MSMSESNKKGDGEGEGLFLGLNKLTFIYERINNF